MCIKNLSYSTETYLQYNVQGGGTGQEIHMSSISRIIPIPKSRNFFAVYQRMISKGAYWAGPRMLFNPHPIQYYFRYVIDEVLGI